MEPYIAEIRWFAGNFAPRGWMLCQGQLLSIAEFEALFTLLGTTFGGDGVTTFGLPDFRGRLPVGAGTGPGLPGVVLGQAAGKETVTLLLTQLPAHSHPANALSTTGNMPGATNNIWAGPAKTTTAPITPIDTPYNATSNAVMLPNAIQPAGGNQPHDNMQPYLVINFIIAVEGIFPSQN